MIYPIKIFNHKKKLVKEYSAKEALDLYDGDVYRVSKTERKDFWDRNWYSKQIKAKDHYSQIVYKPRKKTITVFCKNCKAEIQTASKHRTWCNRKCKEGYKASDDNNN